MAGQLILRKDEFFASPAQAVAVADRYPQNVFAEHTHEFCELVLVWRGNGLHVLNDRPWRITRGDLFDIRAEDKHSYASVNDLVLQNVIYCPDRLRLNFDWAAHIPGLFGTPWVPHWRIGSSGMAQVRQVITQLEHESSRSDAQANNMAELLFAQLALILQRYRYATDNLAATQSEALLDKLLTELVGSLNRPFFLDRFCEREGCSERALRQQFPALRPQVTCGWSGLLQKRLESVELDGVLAMGPEQQRFAEGYGGRLLCPLDIVVIAAKSWRLHAGALRDWASAMPSRPTWISTILVMPFLAQLLKKMSAKLGAIQLILSGSWT